MGTKDDSDDFQPQGALDPTGQLERRDGTRRSEEPRESTQGGFATHEGPLELARERKPESFEEPPPEAFVPDTQGRRSVLKPLLILVVLVALAGAGFVAWPWLKSELRSVLPRGETAVLMINSEPSGATLYVGDSELGTTPFITENIWPEERIPFELRLRGYEPFRGEFRGGVKETVTGTLRRKRAGKAP